MTHDALLHDIYGAVSDPARWPETLTRIADFLGCVGGQLIYNPRPGGQGLMIVGRLDPDIIDLHFKHYTWNPWTVAALKMPFDQPTIFGSLVDRRVVHRTAFAADILRPQGISDALAVSYRGLSHDGGVGGAGFFLSASAIERAEDIRNRFALLAPHLSRAVETTRQFGALSDGSRQLARILDLMPNPGFLLDGRGAIVRANTPGEILLRKGSGLAFVKGEKPQLCAELPNERSVLARSLASALSVAAGRGGGPGLPLRLSRASGEAPLVLIPVPLPPPAFALWESADSARVLVIVIDPAMRHSPSASVLRTTFELTLAEARVASLVASGLSGPEAAQALGISPLTIKTHLARCFEKMNIHSQNELTRILSALPRSDEDA